MKKIFALGFAITLLFLSSCEDDNEIQHDPTLIKTKVALKLQVGEVFYENLNSKVTVEGINSFQDVVWSKEYDFVAGQENILEIPATSDLYRLRVSQWGKTFEHLLSQTQLIKMRADGPVPSTIVFGGPVNAIKLKGYTRYRDKDVDGTIQRLPVSQELYEYQSGTLSKINSYEYNDETHTFDLKRYFLAEYGDHGMSKLKGYLAETDDQFNETVYTYQSDGRLSKIEEINLPENLVNKATLVYDGERPGYVTVTYQVFNGNTFTYSFNYTGGNILSEETRRGGQLCSTGTRTYDTQINPFKHTGYTDFLLSNYSINNQVDEDIQYTACAFPELTIVSQSYIYLDNGYPFSKEITYSNGMKGDERYSYYLD